MAKFQTLNELSAHFGDRPTILEVADPGVPLLDYDSRDGVTPEAVWSTQPAVRTVVDFIASNIAAIPLHVYKRTDDGRVRDRDSAVAKLLERPSPAREQTPYVFWKNYLIDWLLWDRATIRVDAANGVLLRVPPKRWAPKVGAYGFIEKVRIQNNQGQATNFDPEEFLTLVGYSGARFAGVSPIFALEQILGESSEALAFRSMMWKRQATHTGVVQRAEAWDSVEARKNFLEGLRAFDAKSERSGGTMLLDEGMEWKDRKPSFTPSDLNDIEARKLTIVEVCSLYHIAPEMVGARQGNYSNMEAFRQSLYRDNLGPYIAAWEQAVAPLVEMMGLGDDYYIEAFLDSKLRGSFEEQAKTFQTSVGAPTMTRNEARAKMNLPNVPGGDELVTPLNVLVGGQASLTDSGSQNEKSVDPGMRIKSPDAAVPWEQKSVDLLEGFLKRQRESVVAKINGKSGTGYWDSARWNAELADVLHPLAYSVNEQIGEDAAKSLGFTAADYSAPRASAYLRKLSETRAAWINQKTFDALDAGIRNGEDPSDVFNEIISKRGRVAALAFLAAVAGWSVMEASRQTTGGDGYKTWIVTSKNPRASHAAMNGERVPIGQPFGNGASWPGDPVAGVDEVAGCMCGVEVSRTI